MDEHQDLESRLRRLADEPVAASVADAHLRAMADASSPPAAPPVRWRASWRTVVAAALAGLVLGGSGLAAASTDQARDGAAKVLSAVGVAGVPRSTEGCPEGKTYRNHGEYVSEVEAAGGDVEAASKSQCGKPVHAGKGNAKAKGGAPAGGEPRADEDGDPCSGPPPWAGAHLPKAEKEALQAERVERCGAEDADEDVAESREAEEEEEAETSTTVPDGSTTTTAAPSSTTTEATTTTTG